MSAQTRVAAALAKRQHTHLRRDHARKRSRRLTEDADRHRAQADMLSAAEARRLGAEALDGAEPDDAAAEAAAAVIRTVRRKEVAARHALDQLRERDGALVATVDEAEAKLASEVLALFRDKRDAARAIVLGALAELGQALAELAAADVTRSHFIGSTFAFDSREHPPEELWPGSWAVEKFLAALPDRLRPPAFAEAINGEAKRLAEAQIAAIEAEAAGVLEAQDAP